MASRSTSLLLRQTPRLLPSLTPILFGQLSRALLLTHTPQSHSLLLAHQPSPRPFTTTLSSPADATTLLGHDPIEFARSANDTALVSILESSPPLRKAYNTLPNLVLGLSQRVVGATAARTSIGRFLAQVMPANTVCRFSNIPEQMHRDIYTVVQQQWWRLVDDVRDLQKREKEQGQGQEDKGKVGGEAEESERVEKFWDDIYEELNVYMKDKVEEAREIKKRSKGARALMGFGLWRFTPWELREFLFDRDEDGRRIYRD